MLEILQTNTSIVLAEFLPETFILTNRENRCWKRMSIHGVADTLIKHNMSADQKEMRGLGRHNKKPYFRTFKMKQSIS